MTSHRQAVVEECLNFTGSRVVFSDGLQRLHFFQIFEEMYERENSLNTFTYGKIYNLSEVTEFLVILTQGARMKGEEPYYGIEANDKSLLPDTKPFYMWKADDWKKFREHLNAIQASMLRCDANATVSGDEGEGENCAIDVNRSQNKWFTNILLKVLDLFTLHENLAPFREFLEESCSVSGDQALVPLSFPEDLMVDFMETIHKLKEKKIAYALRNFLKNDRTDTFHSPATIRGLLDDPTEAYSYSLFVRRVNKLLRSWATQVFGQSQAVGAWIVSNENITNSEVATDNENALRKLQRSRAQLNASGEDPLPGIVAAAMNANRKPKEQKQHNIMPSEESIDGSEEDDSEAEPAAAKSRKVAKHKRHKMSPKKGGTLLETKPSATRLNFTPESRSENITDPGDDGEVLSDVKRRITVQSSPRKKKKSQVKPYEGRKMWRDVEKAAVIDGIVQLGIGKWAAIKKLGGSILKDRTSTQIKDCFRTMKKRGELDDIEAVWPEKKNDDKGDDDQEGDEGKEESGKGEEEKEESGNNDRTEL